MLKPETHQIKKFDELTHLPEQELIQLRLELDRVRIFLESFEWIEKIVEEFTALFVPGVICIALFKVLTNGRQDYLWTVSGDIPIAYIADDSCTTPMDNTVF